jgi:hypothetical protein
MGSILSTNTNDHYSFYHDDISFHQMTNITISLSAIQNYTSIIIPHLPEILTHALANPYQTLPLIINTPKLIQLHQKHSHMIMITKTVIHVPQNMNAFVKYALPTIIKHSDPLMNTILPTLEALEPYLTRYVDPTQSKYIQEIINQTPIPLVFENLDKILDMTELLMVQGQLVYKKAMKLQERRLLQQQQQSMVKDNNNNDTKQNESMKIILINEVSNIWGWLENEVLPEHVSEKVNISVEKVNTYVDVVQNIWGFVIGS